MTEGSPRIVVFGYDELLLDTADLALAMGGTVVAAVFPSTRRSDPRVADVRAGIEARELPALEQPTADRLDPFAHELRARTPDVGLVWSYPMILPEAVLTIPRFGFINVHMGLLPEYRGANGIQWAIANGEAQTGVTLHYMDAGIDTGPMLAQARFDIGADDDVRTLMRAARRAGIELLRAGWPHFTARRLPAREQDESRAAYHPRRTPEHDRIDWSASTRVIRDLVRATAAPYPGAHTRWQDRTLVVRRCEPADPRRGVPGEIIAVEGAGIVVTCGDGCVRLTHIEEGGRPFTPAEFAGLGGQEGQRLG